jgi:hypothetical protein
LRVSRQLFLAGAFAAIALAFQTDRLPVHRSLLGRP